MKPQLIDAGPLIAVCDVRDRHHAACLAELRRSNRPLLTTWPVLTEAAYMLRDDRRQVADLFSLVGRDRFEVAPLDPAALAWIARFMDQYAHFPAQVADASLMYLAEIHNLKTAFTTDRRDFTRYEKGDGTVLDLVP